MIHIGDCLEVMRGMEAESIDAIVTDPPYGLSFMGKNWDHGIPGEAFWREALRIAKPGTHLLAFGGSRTYHRLTVAIEDAGWEVRDCIMWVYGSGFPKSLDVSKAIDKEAGAERVVVGPNKFSHLNGKENLTCYGTASRPNESAPATDLAKQWQGWGTALKPAYEPIVLARKPIKGTVAANVQEYGTGAVNVDGCKIGTNAGWKTSGKSPNNVTGKWGYGSIPQQANGGRWPANFIHDGSDEVTRLFPDTAPSRQGKTRGSSSGAVSFSGIDATERHTGHGDSGSAARFFYCAKASKADRDEGLEGIELPLFGIDESGFEAKQAGGMDGRNDGSMGSITYSRNHHPTVKPNSLMRYLCRLVTPPGGIILDPFCGSGSTGKAAIMEGFRFIGIEKEAEYAAIAQARIDAARPLEPLFHA